MRTANALWFTAPRSAELRAENVAAPGEGEVHVQAVVSLVSTGTELLVYRGEAPAGAPTNISTCSSTFDFPLKYAYQVVGEVTEAAEGTGYAPGDRVFAVHPHQDNFTLPAGMVSKLPADLHPERLAFRNLVGVAINCLLDVPIRHGDRVAVFGQGIVGSLCAQLARRTAGTLVVIDPVEARREAASAFGADAAVAPDDAADAVAELTGGAGVDVCIEASGHPEALNDAIRATGQEGTIAVVSFFGTKVVPLVLAPEFHYRRQTLYSTMVGRIPAILEPRWTRDRRAGVATDLLRTDWLQTPVSHRMQFADAPEAYAQLDRRPEETSAVMLVYGS